MELNNRPKSAAAWSAILAAGDGRAGTGRLNAAQRESVERSHPKAVTADVDDVAVMKQPGDEIRPSFHRRSFSSDSSKDSFLVRTVEACS